MTATDNEATGRTKVGGRRRTKWLLITLAVTAGVVVLGAAGVGWATYDYSKQYEGELLPGTTIGGVDVSGLTPEVATRRVKQSIGPALDRKISLSFKSKTWSTTPRELGARGNARVLVEQAAQAASEVSLFGKARMSVLDERLDFSREVALTYPRRGAEQFVGDIAAELDREPVDATIDYSSGWVEIAPERSGLTVKKAKTARSLRRAMMGNTDRVQVAYSEPEPSVTAESYDQVLLFRNGENKLYLYDDGKITHSWTVAAGQPEYPTPSGLFEVSLKRYLPTWVNPSPSGWGSSMPASIPPGPGNPLGLRALNWSDTAIRFHGTEATYSLGYNASHGCVRMSNSDVIELYDLVDVGTPIVSIQVDSLKPLYSSSPDPIPVPEDAPKKKSDA